VRDLTRVALENTLATERSNDAVAATSRATPASPSTDVGTAIGYKTRLAPLTSITTPPLGSSARAWSANAPAHAASARAATDLG
jgi:hypothetical protein